MVLKEEFTSIDEIFEIFDDAHYDIVDVLLNDFKDVKIYNSAEEMADDTYDHLVADVYPQISYESWLNFIEYIAASNEWFEDEEEINEIEEFADLIKVIGPEYRGAPYPPFKALCINESEIPDNMRFKYWDVSVIDGGKNIFFDCITQEDFDSNDASEFIKEVKRAIDAMIKEYNFKNQFKLKIKVVCRDGEEYGKVQKELSFNTVSESLTESVNSDYFDKFDDIIHEYLPPMGEGETIATQIVTAVNKLIYKWYNDGDVFDNTSSNGLDGWANDLSTYANWLYKRLNSVRPILDRVYDVNENTYEELLKDLADVTLNKEFLARFADRPALGSIYEENNGPFYFNTDNDYDEGDDYDYDDYYDESLNEKLGIQSENILDESLFDNIPDKDIDELPDNIIVNKTDLNYTENDDLGDILSRYVTNNYGSHFGFHYCVNKDTIKIHSIDWDIEENLNESKGFLKKYKKCSIHDTGDNFTITNEHGKTIGSSKTVIGAEGIIDEYVSKNNLKESHEEPIEYDYEDAEKWNGTFDVANEQDTANAFEKPVKGEDNVFQPVKKLTIDEVKKLAIDNYDNGGDAVAECWTDEDILQWIEEHGTETELLDLFAKYHDKYVDMKGSGEYADLEKTDDDNISNDIDNDNDDDDDDFGPSNPWDAPGMSVRNFIR